MNPREPHHRRAPHILTLAAVSVALTLTAACAPATGTAATTATTTSTPEPVEPAESVEPDADTAAAADAEPTFLAGTDLICTKATKVKVVEAVSGTSTRYAFRPRQVTLQRGGFLAATNATDHRHALIATPDAGIVTSVLDRQERQVIQFPTAGTFTVASADPDHRAALRVRVVGESGCGAPEPEITIVDGFRIRPARLTLAETENFAVVNDSAGAHSLTCTPDPGGNGDHSRLEPGETQLLAIDKAGRYVCGSAQHPRAKAVLTVTAK